MEFRLNELIDIARLQKLTDAFYAVTGFPTAVVDSQGNVLLESGYKRICTFYHRNNSQTRLRCIEIDANQTQQLIAGQSGVLNQCQNGLHCACLPIVVGGDLVGGVITGQLLFEQPDIQFFRGQARQFQFDEEDYLKALSEVPVLDSARLPAVLEFLQQFANLLAEIGLREKKQLLSQAALRLSEQDYRLLAENVNDVIWRLDLKSMRFTYISPSITRMRGYTVEEAMTLGISESLDQESLETVERELPIRLKRFANGDASARVVTDVVRQCCKDGSLIWVEMITTLITGTDRDVVEIVGVSRDISERKHNEALLRSLAQRLENLHEIDRAILAGMPLPDICSGLLARLRNQLSCQRADIVFSMPEGQGAVIMTIDAHGRLRVNDLEVDFSRAKPTASSEDIQEFLIIHDLTEVPISSPLLRNLSSDGLRSFLSIPLHAGGHRFGSLRLCSIEPRAFSSEGIELAVELASELALAMQQAHLREEIARRAMELENRVAARTRQLQTVNRELETFAYSVSHDLKTPLRGIEGYSRLMLEEYAGQLDEQAQTYLNHIERASVKMSQLIDDLIMYSRLERRSKVLGQANITELIQTILLEREDEIKRRQVTVKVDLQCEPVTAEIEGLRQAVRNLLDNALKFTQTSQAAQLEIGSRENGENCLIWFRDNGIGFDMQYHERIFKVFERLHRADDYLGTGIGLAIVRKAMERMGGRAWAESSPGQGAIFYLEFPRNQM